jgi:spermidine synthase
MWSLQMATKTDLDPSIAPASAKAFTKEHKLHYYNEGMHSAAFQLPGFVKAMLKEE